MIRTQSVEKFLEEVASSAPTPGGGAVAAVAGATSASLVEMVINLTENIDSKEEKLKRLKDLHKELLELADKDVLAFNTVMAAYKISKEDKDRKEKIQSAFKEAANVPLKTAQAAFEINTLAKEVLKTGNRNASSDARSAIYLSEAAKKSALANVEINLKYIKDESFVLEIEKSANILRE